MNLREAATLALEALENHTAIKHPQQIHYRDSAIDALRAALAEPHDPVAYDGWVLREVLFDNGEPVGHRAPEQEPVAWNWIQEDKPCSPAYYGGPPDADIQEVASRNGKTVRLLYTSPQPAQPHGHIYAGSCPDELQPNATDPDCPACRAQQPVQEPVAHSIVAGALFDFMGWLTSRRERLVLSSVDNSAPAADAIKDFAEMRGLSINDAQVQEWQGQLTAPPQRKPLTEEELRDTLRQCPHDTVENLRVRWLYAKDFARAIEAAHGIGEKHE